MTDTEEFVKRFRERLLILAAATRGVSAVEAYRVYQTDSAFKGQVEAIVQTAVQVLRGIDVEPDNRLSEIFSNEANGLLGWDVT